MMPGQKGRKQEKPERRVRGEGTVFQREDGRYVARIPLGEGKRKEEYYDTLREAERAKRRMLNERDAGRLIVDRDQTLEEYLRYWLNAHRTEIRETTYSMYHGYLTTRVIPELGQVKLQKLTVEMFQSVYQKWEQEPEPLSPHTIRLIYGIVNEALKDAVKWKKLSYNPNQDVKLPKLPRKKKAKNVYALTDEEVDHVLQCARKLKLYPLFRMALLLGMRIGELSGLKWADIDFEQGALMIDRTVAYIKDPDTGSYRFYVGPPKTDAGERLIQLPRDIVDLLCEHRKLQEQLRASVLGWKDLDLVFCTRYGGYIMPGDIRSRFDNLLAMAGLRHMKFHALRHNASLILRRLKIDPVVRMEMLGHTRLDMTDGVYGHTTQKMHKEAAEELGRLFERERKEE